MPNFSGVWTVTQQMQARGASTWPATPGAPTIGTAAVASGTSASVAFTAPTCTGYPAGGITGYLATSTPGCITGTGASSPITVSGLTTGTPYTFKVKATNATGYGAESAASNSVTPQVQGQQAYITAGTYSWVAPTGVSSVSIVSVGGGAQGTASGGNGYGGGGGGLGYKNNYPVISGNSYTVVVDSGSGNGGTSYFCSASVSAGYGGSVTTGGSYSGDGGGTGGNGAYGSPGCYEGSGGGAAGYSGNGGRGGYGAFTAGSGGGGAGGCMNGGGGVGILGQGANGTISGQGGSGGANASAGRGGAYGGGGITTVGGVGAVRIIWPGTTRSFPTTNTGDL